MRAFVLMAVPLLAGCAATQSAPIPVRADDMLPPAGEWRGSYELPQLNRSGSILFTLVQGEDHAHGDVLMVPAGGNAPLRPAPRARDDERPALQTLTIRFVRVRGDTVTGTLSPYLDPECQCTATASFRGVIHGDLIRGVFETRRPSGTASGTWSVQRHI